MFSEMEDAMKNVCITALFLCSTLVLAATSSAALAQAPSPQPSRLPDRSAIPEKIGPPLERAAPQAADENVGVVPRGELRLPSGDLETQGSGGLESKGLGNPAGLPNTPEVPSRAPRRD
jgi:hypothetical protein